MQLDLTSPRRSAQREESPRPAPSVRLDVLDVVSPAAPVQLDGFGSVAAATATAKRNAVNAVVVGLGAPSYSEQMAARARDQAALDQAARKKRADDNADAIARQAAETKRYDDIAEARKNAIALQAAETKRAMQQLVEDNARTLRQAAAESRRAKDQAAADERRAAIQAAADERRAADQH